MSFCLHLQQCTGLKGERRLGEKTRVQKRHFCDFPSLVFGVLQQHAIVLITEANIVEPHWMKVLWEQGSAACSLNLVKEILRGLVKPRPVWREALGAKEWISIKLIESKNQVLFSNKSTSLGGANIIDNCLRCSVDITQDISVSGEPKRFGAGPRLGLPRANRV